MYIIGNYYNGREKVKEVVNVGETGRYIKDLKVYETKEEALKAIKDSE